VKPVSDATGGVRSIEPIELGTEGLFLLPGDIRLSEFEADLNVFWGECLQRKLRGFRGTTALSDVVNRICLELDIDYVFYDSGPNIGPLNRAIVLDCDYFVVPVACDLFSLRALKTLGRTLVDWISSWRTISDLAPEGISLLPGRPIFLGYIPEGFRIYAGVVTQEHSAFLSRIEKEIYGQIVALLRDVDPDLISGHLQQLKLGEVKHFGALIPASQREGLPLHEVGAGSAAQRRDANRVFAALAGRIDVKVRKGPE
jgi:hypothetical protein